MRHQRAVVPVITAKLGQIVGVVLAVITGTTAR
jgi:hypothetical protein